MKLNQNEFARQVAQAEGGAVNLTIAQVKEVISIAFALLHEKIEATCLPHSAIGLSIDLREIFRRAHEARAKRLKEGTKARRHGGT